MVRGHVTFLSLRRDPQVPSGELEVKNYAENYNFPTALSLYSDTFFSGLSSWRGFLKLWAFFFVETADASDLRRNHRREVAEMQNPSDRNGGTKQLKNQQQGKKITKRIVERNTWVSEICNANATSGTRLIPFIIIISSEISATFSCKFTALRLLNASWLSQVRFVLPGDAIDIEQERNTWQN